MPRHRGAGWHVRAASKGWMTGTYPGLEASRHVRYGCSPLDNTDMAPLTSVEMGSPPPPNVALLAGAVTSAGSKPCTGSTWTGAVAGSSLREYPAFTLGIKIASSLFSVSSGNPRYL